MSLRWAVLGGSLLTHGGLMLWLGKLEAPPARSATAIEVFETVKEPPPPVAAQVDPEPPPPTEAPQRAKSARPAEAARPEPTNAPASHALADLPDFGLELSGGGGPGGLAVPQAAPAARNEPRAPVAKTLRQAPAPKTTDACEEGPAKPKLLNLPQPAYTEAARAAGVEGKVRVELTVDETGKVVSVRALTTLGHGLDEAALVAAQGATFEPAVRCGRPSRSTFTIAIRFSAS